MFYWTCGIMACENVFFRYFGMCYVGMGCFCKPILCKVSEKSNIKKFLLMVCVCYLVSSSVMSHNFMLFFVPHSFFYPHKQLIFLGSRCKHNLPH